MSKILTKLKITQNYGQDDHKGIDLAKTKNRKVFANASGTVIKIQTKLKNLKGSTGVKSWGNYVLIKHPNGYKTRYAHLDKVFVKKGQLVYAGEEIGLEGDTGNAYGIHLHYEVYKNNTRINPTPYIEKPVYDEKQIKYQAYDNKKKKWLPYVDAGCKDYAGNKGNNISAFRVSDLTYQAHDMVKNKWLPWVTGTTDYAGNLPNNIDAIKIKKAIYRVYDNKKKKWLPWVSGDTNYAGNYNNPIGGIQIK